VIYDRSHEHLGSLDIMCIAVRRTVIRAAKALRDHGILPANVDNVALDVIRPAQVVLPVGADWVKETEALRDGTSGAKAAHEIKPLSYLDILPKRREEEIVAGGGGGS
jgi:hypothetical protein